MSDLDHKIQQLKKEVERTGKRTIVLDEAVFESLGNVLAIHLKGRYYTTTQRPKELTTLLYSEFRLCECVRCSGRGYEVIDYPDNIPSAPCEICKTLGYQKMPDDVDYCRSCTGLGTFPPGTVEKICPGCRRRRDEANEAEG